MQPNTNKTFIAGLTVSFVAICVVGFAAYRYFVSGVDYTTYAVHSGPLTEDVLASGKVESVTSASFSFKNQGKIIKVNNKVGDMVIAGQELMLQDTESLDSQLAEMDAGIRVQRARVAQLRAGASVEEVNVVDASASSASTAVGNAETRLAVSKQEAFDVIKNAYTVADDVIRNKTDKLFSNPQSDNPKLILSSVTDFRSVNDLEFGRVAIEKRLKSWERDIGSSSVDVFVNLYTTREQLEEIKKFLDKTAALVNNANNIPTTFSQSMWDAFKVEIALGRASINTSLSSVTAAESSLIQSDAQVKSAKSSLTTATKQLDQTKAKARGTDLAVYQAQLEQAIAAKRKVETLRGDLVIAAPFAGVITQVDAKKGEVVGPTTNVVSMLSYDKFQIKVNIVENNIIKVRVGQSARITFDAMPNKEFSGKVIAIDPAEKEINGTIYYQATVELVSVVDFLRPGLSANVWVITQEVPSALYVPVSALSGSSSSWKVKVFSSGSVIEKVVETGFKDRNGMIQVVSGLQEGESVILDSIK